ncbi:hypothetical protein ACFWD7_06135 [Streptomyces mirabilis]|uniref:hypothetical protein n=1 Tax=Streptomyces mirabilis TaxID=68239 RepID=UPI0036B26041
MTDQTAHQPLTDQQLDDRAEIAKLVRWHREDGAEMDKQRATISRLRARASELEVGLNDLAALVSQWHNRAKKAEARVAELEAAPATVPPAYELATRAHLGAQLREVLGRCAKRANEAEQPLRRDLIARGMGLLSALHLVEEGSADNTEQDGEFAGYDEDADPPGGFPDEPIPYSDPTGFPADTLLWRRGIHPAPVAAVVSSAAETPGSAR